MRFLVTAMLATTFLATTLLAQERRSPQAAQASPQEPPPSSQNYALADLIDVPAPVAAESDMSCLHWTLPKADKSTVSAGSLKVPDKARNEYVKACGDVHSLKLGEAESHLRRAVKRYPEYAEAWIVLGQVLAAQTHLSEAQSACARGSTADASFAPAQLCLADISALQDHWQESLDHADRAIQIAPVQNVFGQFYCALAYFHLNRLAEAERDALAAVEADPSNRVPEVHILLAQIYGAKHDYAAAAAQLRSYLNVAPKSPAVPSVQLTLAQLESQPPN
jgi:tetratricopeptide (TPR) repeat protein